MKDWEYALDAIISDFSNDIDYLESCWIDIDKKDVDHVKVLHILSRLTEMKKELIKALNNEM